jgi:hypothetical protein
MEHNSRSLPDELIERILVSAWCTLTLPDSRDKPYAFAFGEACEGYRWIFLRTMSLLCSQWRRVVLGVALQNIVIQTQADSDLMRVVAHAALRDLGLQDRDSTEWNQAYRDLFRHSIMTINVDYYRRSKHDSADWFKTVIQLCPSDEASNLIPSIPDVNTLILRKGRVSDLAIWLGQCLHIQAVVDMDYWSWRPDQITLLREIQHFCTVLPHHTELDSVNPSKYQRVTFKTIEICVGFPHPLVYKLSPNASHWLQKLHILYLNAPASGGGTSHIQPWCIKTSLKSGLLAQRSSIGTFTIRILGGRTIEEKSWQNALTACLANGVLLEYYDVYEDGQGESIEHMFAGEHGFDSYDVFLLAKAYTLESFRKVVEQKETNDQ